MAQKTPKIVQNNNFIFYAPGINTGGGLVLLKEILNTKNFANNWSIYLDERTKFKLDLPKSAKNIIYIKNSIYLRLLSEWKLRQNSNSNHTVLCFHGLPPLLPIKSKVIVFIQNRILLDPIPNNSYSTLTKLSILFKKAWLFFGARANIKYVVQTPSMLKFVKEFLGEDVNAVILPFAPQHTITQDKNLNYIKKFDFIYPASGESHKNHINLLKAWKILADMNIKPFLALTINTRLYPKLFQLLQKYTQEYQLDIVNLGELSSSKILDLYSQVSAVIFPSKVESFGLPLIEATERKLPILAAELDYVRDVSNPVETFDPNSPTSIARAVRRFLGSSEALTKIESAKEFLKIIETIF